MHIENTFRNKTKIPTIRTLHSQGLDNGQVVFLCKTSIALEELSAPNKALTVDV